MPNDKPGQLTIWGRANSVNVQKVLWCAEEFGLSYRRIDAGMAFGRNTVTIVLITILWTWVFNRARGSILIATLMHASLNATGQWVGGVAGQPTSRAGGFMMALYGALAILALVSTRGRLGYTADDEPVTGGTSFP